MKYKIKKKLIHFYTSGNIVEDFVASRRKKVSALRNIIRVCFYLHCAAALICIGLSLLLGTSIEVVAITVSTVAAAWLALFAVGDVRSMKLLLIAADLVLAAAGFTVGALTVRKAVFISSGAVMTVAAFYAMLSYFASRCKDYLENYSPRLIRRDDYTLLHNFSSEPEDILTLPDSEELPPLPPLTSEMRELAKQLSEILNTPSKKEPEDNLIDEITGSSHAHENEEKTPL